MMKLVGFLSIALMASWACSDPQGVEPENCDPYDRVYDVILDDDATAPFGFRWRLEAPVLAAHERRALVFCEQGTQKLCVLQRCANTFEYRGQLPLPVRRQELSDLHEVITDDEIFVLSQYEDNFLGAILVFVEGETGWEMTQTISGGTDQRPVKLLGGLEVSGDTMVAIGRDQGTGEPHVYVFSRIDGTWVRSGVIEVGQSNALGAGWISVSLQPERLVLGLPYIDTVWTYERVGSDWQRVDELLPPQDRGPPWDFGDTVVQGGEWLAVFGGGFSTNYRGGWALNVYRRENDQWIFDDLYLEASVVGEYSYVAFAFHDTRFVFSGLFGEQKIYPRIFEHKDGAWHEQQPLMAEPLYGARALMTSDVIYFEDYFATTGDITTYIADVAAP